ncbi:MAG: zf-TFIIB domain-containing protein [Comamonadaceae bacterium]|nr:zf-TFIIB domain-containing protein [Comamonadaceae bacterium]
MVSRLAPPPTACPSCRQPMEVRHYVRTGGGTLELDLCHACQGLWFDARENLQLAPEGVLALLGDLHAHRNDAHQPLAARLGCPRCRRTLAQGVDVVRSGRYFTYRCPQHHGRFATFAAFMVEKGFVRQLTRPEIADLAERVRVIQCTGCGAPVDLRQHDACPYCRSAFSLLDPQAVERALSGFHQAARQKAEGPRPEELADALANIARDRERARREEMKEARHTSPLDMLGGDLWAAGLELVWRVLRP